MDGQALKRQNEHDDARSRTHRAPTDGGLAQPQGPDGPQAHGRAGTTTLMMYVLEGALAVVALAVVAAVTGLQVLHRLEWWGV